MTLKPDLWIESVTGPHIGLTGRLRGPKAEAARQGQHHHHHSGRPDQLGRCHQGRRHQTQASAAAAARLATIHPETRNVLEIKYLDYHSI